MCVISAHNAYTTVVAVRHSVEFSPEKSLVRRVPYLLEYHAGRKVQADVWRLNSEYLKLG